MLTSCSWQRIRRRTMSITVNLRYKGKDGAAKRFAEEMVSSGTVDKIRSEAGNLRYEYYQSLDDPETILLIDSWEDQESIDVHHASPMMKTIMELREKYDLHMTVERYKSDDSMPESDADFIRK
jgi:quinol monooxygenase YgiN